MKLAVSLHAADDALRRRLMPIARKVSLAGLFEACRQVYRITGRRITFEYIVLPGVNDRDDDVRRLARLTEGLPCKINLIAYNPVAGMDFRSPSDAEVERFQQKILKECRLAVTYRRSRGGDIAGACGQLAAGCHLSAASKKRPLLSKRPRSLQSESNITSVPALRQNRRREPS